MPANPTSGSDGESAVVATRLELGNCRGTCESSLRLKVVEAVRIILCRDLLDFNDLVGRIVIAEANFVLTCRANLTNVPNEDGPRTSGDIPCWTAVEPSLKDEQGDVVGIHQVDVDGGSRGSIGCCGHRDAKSSTVHVLHHIREVDESEPINWGLSRGDSSRRQWRGRYRS